MGDELLVGGIIDVLRAKVLEYIKLFFEEGIKKIDFMTILAKVKDASIKATLVFLEEIDKSVDTMDFGSLTEFVRPALKNIINELRKLLLGGVLANA